MGPRAISIESNGSESNGVGADAVASGEIAVTSVECEGSRVAASVAVTPEARRYFTGDEFYVEYDVDVSAVPESVQVIPVLAQICPVAWAVGVDVRVPVVDRRFLDGLQRAGATLCEMYPSLMEGGRVIADAAPEPDVDGDPSGAGLMFTGGVDSLASYVRHREEAPTLINVRGWTVGAADDRWRHARAAVESYGDRLGVETQFVRSNMLEFIDASALNVDYADEVPGAWYSAVGSGLGMVGLCAPLTVAEGLGTLYVAATHWDGFPLYDDYAHWDGRAIPWGSHPRIDDHLGWGDTAVVHDGFEITRQDRVELIAEFVREEQPDLPLRACESSPTAGNCNGCEKCFRTALGLAFAGLDPNEHGFDLDADDYADARAKIGSGEWLSDHQEFGYWEEFGLLAHDRDELPVPDDQALLSWLRSADFAAVSGAPATDRAIRTVARSLPDSVFDGARRLYTTVSEAQRRLARSRRAR